MNINRYNYEEFFLLYVDNELTRAEREAVDAFVHENPDLEEELVMLKQSRLRPDTSIQFMDKASLMKPETSGSFISEANYEEFFLLYVDDELDTVARREVEAFAASNPALQQELNLLLQTRSVPDHTVIFPDKSLLYKQSENERRPIVIAWRRVVAVAAMVLLALGIFWVYDRQPNTPAAIVKRDPQPQNQAKGQDEQGTTAGNQQQQKEEQQPVELQERQQQQLAAEKKTQQNSNKQTTVRSYDKPVNSNRQLAHNEPIKDPSGETTAIAMPRKNVAGIESNTADRNISTGIETANVTSAFKAAGEPLVHTAAFAGNALQTEEEDNEAFGPVSVKKNKLRGLFRKVTRVFEKTTNLPATEERGILIGNIEIALK